LKLNKDEQESIQGAKSSAIRRALLLGLGLDGEDGHMRITTGPNFQLVGGSRDTHGVMQETAIKFNEELAKRGKKLDQIGPKEFVDILHRLA
jgi:hypothetical protein